MKLGIAFLPDGRRMDYDEYVKTKEWRRKREDRLIFDNFSCGCCHTMLIDKPFETHHMNYERLGNEDVEKDLITMCLDCHKMFHVLWSRTKYWESNQDTYHHWKSYSLPLTTELCCKILTEDIGFGGNRNLCSRGEINLAIDSFLTEKNSTERIAPEDIQIFIRNRRYKEWINANKSGETLENFLTRRYGEKNKTRSAMRAFLSKHNVSSIRGIITRYSGNVGDIEKQILKMEEEKNEQA